MEGLKSYENYRASVERRQRELDRTRMLENQSTFYASRIKRDLKNFLVQTSTKTDCTMKKKYNRILQKSLKKNYGNSFSHSMLPSYRNDPCPFR